MAERPQGTHTGAPPASGGSLAGGPPPLDSLAEQLALERVRARLLGEAPTPRRVDRFVLERRLGAGGMGTVWSAFDERLDRTIALKFLRADGAAHDEARAFAEGQSLAKLSHPNVIPVYDVGVCDGRTWIAMEFIPGRTLRRWIAEERPSPRAILAAWVDAGRGLAAVHAAGLVHRDLKPDNVMMGDDGRVRLIDFGLVTREEQASTRPDGGAGPRTDRAFVGTPAYAAPEQLAGAPLDARCDQYAFCVCVWEALCGARPQRAAPRRTRALRRRLRRALARGLAERPGDRHPSMLALVRALSPPSRRWIAPAAGALLLGLAAGASLELARPADDPCAAADRGVDALWTRARQRAIAGRGDDLRRGVDDWTTRWRASARAACAAVHVERLAPESSLTPRKDCLQGHLDDLALALDLVERAASPVDARRLLAKLGEPGLCMSAAVLAPDEPAAPLRPRIGALTRELSRLRWGHDGRAATLRQVDAIAVFEEATQLGHAPLIGQALLVRAGLARQLGAAAEARRLYGEALDLAQGGAPLLTIDALLGLHAVALELDVDLEQASWFDDRAQGALDRLPEAKQRMAGLLVERGRRRALRGESEQAAADLRAAAERYASLGPTQDYRRAAALRSLAELIRQRGDEAEARRLREAIRALEGRALDESRADFGRKRIDDAIASLEAGDAATAEALAREGLDALVQETGSDSLDVGNAHVALAGIYDAAGDLEAASLHANLADAMIRDSGGPGHPDRLYALSALGTVDFRLRRFERSAAAFERALRIAEALLDEGAPLLNHCRANLGEALHELGRDREAERLLRQALAGLEQRLGPRSTELSIPRKALGAVLTARGALDEARPLLERARDDLPPGSLEQAETRLLLARVLVELGERDAGVDEAAAARAIFAAMPATEGRLRAVDAWIHEATTHRTNRERTQ
ncbi:MAG: serine/threonine-protein kinase [Nannocystaceae bacterium]